LKAVSDSVRPEAVERESGMKIGYMVGAGVLTVAAGMFLAWSLDNSNSAQASIEGVEPGVISVAEGDTGMASARDGALSTFDQFWSRVSADKSGLDAISIKVAVPHANGSEHLWMTGCQSGDAQKFNCVVSNEPIDVALKLGARYQFSRGEISDWMYRQDGKIHGGYSIRELLPKMPADQAAQMTAMLAPLPQ